VDIVSLALVVAHGAARHPRTIGKVRLGPIQEPSGCPAQRRG
jgi:hypothetical protein